MSQNREKVAERVDEQQESPTANPEIPLWEVVRTQEEEGMVKRMQREEATLSVELVLLTVMVTCEEEIGLWVSPIDRESGMQWEKGISQVLEGVENVCFAQQT